MKSTPKLPRILLSLSILLVLFVSACGNSNRPSPPSTSACGSFNPTSTGNAGDLAKIASDIIHKPTDVGKLEQTSPDDPHCRVIVFEEVHSSVTGQVEIALMLNRLYERYQLRSIGLEGAFVGKPLDASWFRSSPAFRAYDDVGVREDVIVQMLEKGEISSSEMMALIYSDMKVSGIEDPNQYNSDTLSSGASSAADVYLFEIASQKMTPSQTDECNNLTGQAQIDCVMGTDPWVKQEYALINDQTQILSFQRWFQILDEIKQKAVDDNISISPDEQANLQALRNFFEIADQRSVTMANNTLKLLKSPSSNGLVAMTIGAQHIERVAELLKQAKVSFVVIAGNSFLANDGEKGQLSDEAYSRKTLSPPLSVDPSGMLGSFLDGRAIKPQPVLDQAWFQTQCAISMLVAVFARKVAEGQRPLDALNQLPTFAGVIVNADSLQMGPGGGGSGSYGVFSVTARDHVIWVKVIIPEKRHEEKMEQRLEEAYGQVKDSLPQPEKITKPVRVRVSSDVIAVFGRNEQSVKEA